MNVVLFVDLSGSSSCWPRRDELFSPGKSFNLNRLADGLGSSGIFSERDGVVLLPMTVLFMIRS